MNAIHFATVTIAFGRKIAPFMSSVEHASVPSLKVPFGRRADVATVRRVLLIVSRASRSLLVIALTTLTTFAGKSLEAQPPPKSAPNNKSANKSNGKIEPAAPAEERSELPPLPSIDRVPNGVTVPAAHGNGRKPKMYLNSWSFRDGGPMPKTHSCLDRSISPPVRFRHVPPQSKTLVFVVEDLDVPTPENPSSPRVHWLLYNIPSDTPFLVEGLGGVFWGGGYYFRGWPFNAQFEAKRGMNDFGYDLFTGFCPSSGRHRYKMTAYAVDIVLPDMQTPNWPRLRAAIRGHVMEQASMIGTFDRDEFPISP